MPLKYSVIEIYTSEEVQFDGIQIQDAVIEYIRALKIAARCIVFRSIQGCYESGEIATQKILDLSYHMPLKIEVVLPSPELEHVLPKIEDMVGEGIIGVRQMEISVYKTTKHLFPRHLKVKDIMTISPQTLNPDTPLYDAVKILLSSIFTGIPVVDTQNYPVGIITQGDLIYRAGLPMRLGLLSVCDPQTLSESLKPLSDRNAGEIMSHPAVCIDEDQPATDAVNLMIEKNLKRFPVINKQGIVTGIVSRLDIFRTIMRESPDWETFNCRRIKVNKLNTVCDIMRRDIHTVSPGTSVEEVIRMIGSNDIQRVAVVDDHGIFLGLISDRDLLTAFSEKTCGIWNFFMSKIPFTERKRQHQDVLQCLQSGTAGEVMKTDLVIVNEDTPLQNALKLMTEKALKRLPVIDQDGKFKGMISRDSLLRTEAKRGAMSGEQRATGEEQ
jgi:CBS domain-containing protein